MAAVTPAGRFSAARVMPPVKLVRVTDTVDVAPAFCAMVSEVGDNDMVYEAGVAALTVRANDAVDSVTPLPLACTVSGYTPGVTDVATLSVTCSELDPLVGACVTDPVTPVGAPVTVMATSPVKPPPRVTLPLTTVDPPCWIVALVGVTVRVMVPVPPPVSLLEPQA